MKLTDKIQLGKRTTDSNGFVSVPAVITKVGVQRYHVTELMRDADLAKHLSGKTGLINVFRSPDTVFNPMTIDSFKNLPVTVQHPESMVNPETSKFVNCGHISGDVDKLDDTRLGATIYLHDADAINLSLGSETSAGYDCPIIYEQGEYNGEKYDFKFDGAMIGNHLALVPNGRCGEDVGVLDNKTEKKQMTDQETKDLVTGEVTKAVDSAVESAVEKAVAGIDIGKIVTDALAKSQKEAEEKAEAKAKEDAKTEEARTDASAKMDARVALHTKLSLILDADYDTAKTDKELMVLAVGETVENADEKTDEYLAEKITDLAQARKDVISSHKTDEEFTGTIKLRAF